MRRNTVASFDIPGDGILVGTISEGGATELLEVFIVVDHRMVGRAPVSWESENPGATRPGRLGSFTYDLRDIPPDLLIGSDVEIEIRPQHEPTIILARRTIRLTGLYPLSNVPKGRDPLEGYIDTRGGDIVSGWVWDPTAPQRRILISLFVDEVFCGHFVANSLRPDLEATGRGDGGYGFNIRVREFLDHAGGASPKIQLVTSEPEFWYVPLAPHLEPRRSKWFSLTRLIRIPATTRELAAHLMSDDALPKKTFVLERAQGRIPDSFSTDYLLLCLEFLRIEMAKTIELSPSTLAGRMAVWLRHWVITRKMRRLTALAQTTAAAQDLLRKRANAPLCAGETEASS